MRPSKWGNPYSHMQNTSARYKVKTRQEAIDMFREDVMKNPVFKKEIKTENIKKLLTSSVAKS